MYGAAWALTLSGFSSGGLGRVMAWYLLDVLPFATVPLIFLLLSPLARGRPLRPAARVSLALMLPSQLLYAKAFGWVPLAFPVAPADASPAVVVRLPSDAPLQVAWGGDDIGGNYHAAYPSQRWAYDLVIEPAFHGGSDPAAYGCWGTPVRAPAAGEVVSVATSHEDHVPGALPEGENAPCGNLVALRLPDTETHLVLCHLQRDSVEVGVGQRVEEGQVLGRCGNSGNSSEPHIHVHHQRQEPDEALLFAEGLPLSFRDHEGPATPVGGFSTGASPRPVGDRVRHVGRAAP
jgi:hypothetical protein